MDEEGDARRAAQLAGKSSDDTGGRGVILSLAAMFRLTAKGVKCGRFDGRRRRRRSLDGSLKNCSQLTRTSRLLFRSLPILLTTLLLSLSFVPYTISHISSCPLSVRGPMALDRQSCLDISSTSHGKNPFYVDLISWSSTDPKIRQRREEQRRNEIENLMQLQGWELPEAPIARFRPICSSSEDDQAVPSPLPQHPAISRAALSLAERGSSSRDASLRAELTRRQRADECSGRE